MSREAFEEWASKETNLNFDLVREGVDGTYIDFETEYAFLAWQARQPEIDALEAEVERLRERTKELKPSQYQLENWEKFV